MKRPSAALVVATAALCFAVVGTGVAANHYLITSTKQIKPSVLKKLRGNTGPRGIQGIQGIQGVQGNPGTFSSASLQTVTTVASINHVLGFGSADVTCPGSTHVISGGYTLSNTGPGYYVTEDYPSNSTTWRVFVVDTTADTNLTAYAICG